MDRGACWPSAVPSICSASKRRLYIQRNRHCFTGLPLPDFPPESFFRSIWANAPIPMKTLDPRRPLPGHCSVRRSQGSLVPPPRNSATEALACWLSSAFLVRKKPSDRKFGRKSTRLVVLASWALACVASSASLPIQAEVLQARLAGGLISGSLGSTNFSNASYEVFASYDPAGVLSGTLASFPAAYVAVTPTITIDTGSGLVSGTLQPFSGFSWYLVSLAVTANDSRSGFVPIDGSLNLTNAFDITAAVPKSTLLTQVLFSGDSNANDPATWPTTAGSLDITASTDAAGSFAIVPEPGSLVSLGMGLLMLVGRRRFTTGVGSPKT